jgi:hypothetical protein
VLWLWPCSCLYVCLCAALHLLASCGLFFHLIVLESEHVVRLLRIV